MSMFHIYRDQPCPAQWAYDNLCQVILQLLIIAEYHIKSLRKIQVKNCN